MAESMTTSIRLDLSLMTRLDVLAGRLTRPGQVATRTDAIRVALVEGLDACEAKFGHEVEPVALVVESVPPEPRKRPKKEK
jgi:hypothetical protein